MVQSLGISVGNLNSYVAAGQAGGIEILLNDYSSRATPSMVGFTDKIRCMGVDASQNLVSNLKNTIYDLMLLVGKPFEEQLQINSNNNHQFKLEAAQNGQGLVVVRYLGAEKKFSITQVLAMLFTKLRSFANDSTDCVISCPQFYTEQQKTALYEAALIAGLNPLQIISDMSAVIMNYVYYRTTNKENTNKFIAFINFGHSNLQTCVTWLQPGKDRVRILASDSEPIGGKDFDEALANYFIHEHKLKLTPKAHIRLLAGCEKLKKLLSSNPTEIPLHIESLVSEDKDFTAHIDRTKFEELCSPLLERVRNCFRRTLNAYQQSIVELTSKKASSEQVEQSPAKEDPKMSVDEEAAGDEAPTEPAPQAAEAARQEPAKTKTPEKDKKDKKSKKSEDDGIPKDVSLSIEIVGGSSRIPAVKQLINEIFQVAPSTTLNTDEAVARGCVLHCATLHPGIKVSREVKIVGSESFFNKGNTFCDKEDRRVELELILNDKKYKATTEARNNLEEYIYSERASLVEGDEFLAQLSATLDWVWSDEGEEASEEEYTSRLNALKKIKESRLAAAAKAAAPPQAEDPPSNGATTDAPAAPDSASEEAAATS